MIVHRMAKAV